MAIIVRESLRAVFYTPFYAAFARNAYAAEGIDVVLHPAATPEEAAAALRSGEADVIWGGPLRVLLQRERHETPELVCFCGVVTRDPFIIVGREPRPNFTLSDLVGPRIATVSEVPTPWVCLQEDLRQAGLNPGNVVRILGRSMAANADSLRRGECDAVQLFEPYVEQLVRDGAHIWYAGAQRGYTIFTSFSTRRELLPQRRADFVAMTRAMATTLAWLHAAPAEAIAETVARFFPAVPPSVLASAIERYRTLAIWEQTPVIQREGFARLRASMVSAGLLETGASYDECVATL
jgi:NitT/TauT family transport system substrate-binding protein